MGFPKIRRQSDLPGVTLRTNLLEDALDVDREIKCALMHIEFLCRRGACWHDIHKPR